MEDFESFMGVEMSLIATYITKMLHRSKETNNHAYKLTTHKLQPRCYNVLTSIFLPVSH